MLSSEPEKRQGEKTGFLGCCQEPPAEEHGRFNQKPRESCGKGSYLFGLDKDSGGERAQNHSPEGSRLKERRVFPPKSHRP